MPWPAQEIYPAVHRGELYVAGGIVAALPGGKLNVSSRLLSFDPKMHSWRDAAALPFASHHGQLVSQGGRLFLIGGFRAGEDGDWIASDKVASLGDDGWRRHSAMPLRLAESCAAAIEDRIHLVSGRTPAGRSNASWRDHIDVATHLALEPGTGRWTEAPPIISPRNSAASAVVENKFLVCGGRTVSGGLLDDLLMFDPSLGDSGRWISLAPMPEARAGHAAAIIGHTMYVFGGEWFGASGSGVFKSTLSYNVTQDRWAILDPMPIPRHGLGAVALEDRIFVIGGAERAGAAGTTARLDVFKQG